MTIEKDLTRIADALETLVSKLAHIGVAVDEVPLTAAEIQANLKKAREAADQVKKPGSVLTDPSLGTTALGPIQMSGTINTGTIAPPPADISPPPIAPITMSPNDLNTALVTEFKRLGSRDKIDEVMRGKPFEIQSVHDLKPEQYEPLLDAVRAVKAA